MTTHSAPITREHHFYVAIAKIAFIHDKHGIVFVRDPMSLADAARYGLKPLILYGITVAGTPIRWATFSSADKPRPLCSVLQEAWRNAPGLRGCPDVVKINRHISSASPDLAHTLASFGIKLVVAEGSDKQFSSSLRTAQGDPFFLYDKPINSLDSLCSAAQYSHDFYKTNMLYHCNKRDIAERVSQWIELPERVLDRPPLPYNLDWTPGAWLSSWETNLPATSPRYYYSDGPEDKTKWIILGHDEVGESLLDGNDTGDDYNCSAIESVKNVVACWPNTPAEVTQAADLTGRQLQWFLSNRTQLSWSERMDLLGILGIELVEYGDYMPVGPCVLIANNIRAIASIYESISHGGDLDFSFEVVPDKTNADPSWRYILFQNCCGKTNIIMVSRGSKISDLVDKDLFINFEGIKVLPAAFYRDVVSTCARACATPRANKEEIEKFWVRNRIFLAETQP